VLCPISTRRSVPMLPLGERTRQVDSMIVLFTDFGLQGPYTGQMKAVLRQMAPDIPVIDLFADAPVGNPKASAYLLAVYAAWFPAGTVFLGVVDPGVGGTRPSVILKADGQWYVGPGNGLFELVQRRAGETRSWEIDWRPEHLSASFHGRDLFAPVAAMLARGEPPPGRPRKDDADRLHEFLPRHDNRGGPRQEDGRILGKECSQYRRNRLAHSFSEIWSHFEEEMPTPAGGRGVHLLVTQDLVGEEHRAELAGYSMSVSGSCGKISAPGPRAGKTGVFF